MLAELDDIEKTALDQLAGVTATDGLETWRIECPEAPSAKASLSLIPHKSDFRSEVAWREDDGDTCDTYQPAYPPGFVHFEA